MDHNSYILRPPALPNSEKRMDYDSRLEPDHFVAVPGRWLCVAMREELGRRGPQGPPA